MNHYQIILSDNAKRRIENIVLYLEHEWSKKVKDSFKSKLLHQISFLKQNPYMYPASEEKKDIRRCIITKHNIMYYRIVGKDVEIITIHDTRSDPKNLDF